MKRNTIGKYTRQVLREFSDLWSMHPRLSAHKTSDHPGARIDEADQVHSGERMGAQRAALNTWEGEGGSTAAPCAATVPERLRTQSGQGANDRTPA